MAYLAFNPNPTAARVGDCVIRALSAATGKCWEKVYAELAVTGFMLADMPSSNAVWAKYLEDNGFTRHVIDYCPGCYTVKDFCLVHPEGVYVLGTGTHAVAVIDGNYVDAWDSGDETPIYYFSKGEQTK